MKLRLLATLCLLVSALAGAAQDLRTQIQVMKGAYAQSGSIVLQDDRTLVIEPNMPGPICGLPRMEDGKAKWSFYIFPLASITVPLATVDESLIAEDVVFTNPDAQDGYKPGDMGDTTMIVVVGIPGKQFHTLMYDRQKLLHLGPGPHNGAAYGQAAGEVEAFGLTFSDRASARSFVDALRRAAVLAKEQASNR